MCCSFRHCCSDSVEFGENFVREVEQTDDGLNIKIKARSPEKAEALKKMFEAHKELCDEKCC
jgi:hypothetical protein